MNANQCALLGGIFGTLLLATSGCVLAPEGLKDQQKAVERAGLPYTRPVAKRDMPYVPFQPTWQQVLHRAFLADGDLEIAYDQWANAVARVREMGAYPNTPLAPGFSYLFSPGNMTAWNRTTLTAGPDPQTDLSFPGKSAQAGRTAYDEALAAAKRFEAAKFDLQKRVLSGYFDLVAMDQKIQIQRENVELLKVMDEEAQTRVQAGGAQQEILKSQIDLKFAENDLAAMESTHETMLTGLNALMGRNPEAAILAPEQMPAPRPLPADDETLLTIAVDNNPELAALAEEAQGRQDALELARMQYIPDFNPMAAITGSVSQSVGVVVILPFTTPKIAAQVDEAEAALAESQALARQTKEDRAASFVTALLSLRDDERAGDLLEKEVLPRAKESARIARDSYTTGSMGFGDVIDAQRTLLQVRTMIVDARMDREKRLAELEQLAGTDLTTLQPLPFYLLHPRPMRLHGPGPTPKPSTRLSPSEIFVQ